MLARFSLQDRTAREPPTEYLDRRLHLNVVGLQKDDRLSESLDVCRHDELVGCLNGLARSGGSHTDDRLTHCAEVRRGTIKGMCLAADHDRKAPFNRPCFSSTHRSVQGVHASCRTLEGDASCDVGPNSAHIDEEETRRRKGEDAALTQHHRFDVG